MKMLAGEALEKGLRDMILSNLHLLGIHLIGSQVPVGGSNPNWDGYVDDVLGVKENATWDNFVLEIKTKSGVGANKLFESPEPDLGHLTQIGLYLHDLYSKAGIKKGCLLYFLLSDSHFGDMIQINCSYDPETQTVRATDFEDSNGRTGSLTVSVNIKDALKRWEILDYHIAKRIPPQGEYKYIYPLDQESMRDISDSQLRKIIKKESVPGDWQIKYSNYKDKALAADGWTSERIEKEMDRLAVLATTEYRRRFPNTKY